MRNKCYGADRRPFLLPEYIVASLAALVGCIALIAVHTRVGVEGDPAYYLSVAQNISEGKGFVQDRSFWPDVPTMGRTPVWPLFLAVMLFVLPGIDPELTMRLAGLVLHVAAAAMICALTRRITRNRAAGLLAGLFAAVNPSSVFYALTGWSEPSFVVLVTIAAVLLGGVWRFGKCAGCLVLGLAALCRSNFLLFPLFFAAGLILFPELRKQIKLFCRWREGVACLALFLLPACAWVFRNYGISGEFPVLSTIEGETLYGANNSHVANNLSHWGYWVFPDQIPGEVKKSELAETFSEYELHKYYHAKGIDYLRKHWFEMPRLILGKLIRAYVPVPWNPAASAYVIFGYRFLLLALVLLFFPTWLRRIEPQYAAILGGMFLTNLFMVVVYYGCSRFTFCLEFFLLPCAAIALVEVWNRRASAALEISRTGDVLRGGKRMYQAAAIGSEGIDIANEIAKEPTVCPTASPDGVVSS